MARHQPFDTDSLSRAITLSAQRTEPPYIVAIDGRSGAGKSTLAAALAQRLGACVIEGDDFFAGGTVVRTDSPDVLADVCIDWTRQRAVLEILKAGRSASWRAFDWDAFDGRLCDALTTVGPAPVVILEGVYSARPELSDLLHLRVKLDVADDVRLSRIMAREGVIGPWDSQWHAAEVHYFGSVMPADRFDMVVRAS